MLKTPVATLLCFGVVLILADLETMFLIHLLLYCLYSFASQFECAKFADTFTILTVHRYRAAIITNIFCASHGDCQEKRDLF